MFASRFSQARRFGHVAGLFAFVVTAAALITSRTPSALAAAVHIGLASSVPAKDAHLMSAPTEIRLTFTGPIDVSKAGVELLAADGKPVALDPLRAVSDSPRVAAAKITGALAGGNYTVKWNAVAADGAKGTGSFGFMYMKQPD